MAYNNKRKERKGRTERRTQITTAIILIMNRKKGEIYNKKE